MIPNRHSDGSENPDLRRARRTAGETANGWVTRNVIEEHAPNLVGSILLIGGRDLMDFRLRVAQSHVRHDMQPSHWSHAALVSGAGAGQGDIELLEVALVPDGGFGDVPSNNGIQQGKLSAYDDARRFPNIAWLDFGWDEHRVTTVAEARDRFRMERHIVDIPALIVEWLGFVWGVGAAGNPLLNDRGMPSAAGVEGICGLADMELTPGLSSMASCPEAIWQAAKWWRGFYEADGTGTIQVPKGVYDIGQRLVE